jgi:hypothetical protein
MIRRMRTLAAAALLLLAASTAVADARSDFGDAPARALETAVGRALSGARITWEGEEIRVTLADGAKSRVTTPGFLELARPQGPLYVMEIELPDFAREQATTLRSFGATPPPAQHPADLFVAMQTNPAGEVLAIKIGRLDPTAAFIDTRQFELTDDSENAAWPAVKVTYWGFYGTSDWHGSVRWFGAYDSETMSIVSRLPLGLMKTRKGGDLVQDQLLASRLTPEVIHIEGGLTGTAIDFPCAYPCTFDGRALLASW